MNILLKLIPASFIRAAGRMQFKYPFLRGPINYFGQSLAGRGVIQRGEGRGLHFNARGCNPGYLAGTSAPEEQALLAKYCRPGGVVYDLGANAGFYVVIAARLVGPAGSVYAFEPTPTLVARIRENAAMNGFKNVHPVEAAVCDRDGTLRFGISGPLSVNNSLQSASSEQSIEVKSVRLDTFCAEHPAPDLLMIDIEGAELEALSGAMEMIARHRPVILLEVHWLGQPFLDFVEKHLKPLGYCVTTYEGGALPAGNERYHALMVPGGV